MGRARRERTSGVEGEVPTSTVGPESGRSIDLREASRAWDRCVASGLVDFGSTNGCWSWTGACSESGYGLISLAPGRRYRAHRVSLVVKRGADLAPGMVVDHRCGNRRCVNPEHLEAVTQGENLRRMKQRRLLRAGARGLRIHLLLFVPPDPGVSFASCPLDRGHETGDGPGSRAALQPDDAGQVERQRDASQLAPDAESWRSILTEWEARFGHLPERWLPQFSHHPAMPRLTALPLNEVAAAFARGYSRLADAADSAEWRSSSPRPRRGSPRGVAICPSCGVAVALDGSCSCS